MLDEVHCRVVADRPISESLIDRVGRRVGDVSEQHDVTPVTEQGVRGAGGGHRRAVAVPSVYPRGVYRPQPGDTGRSLAAPRQRHDRTGVVLPQPQPRILDPIAHERGHVDTRQARLLLERAPPFDRDREVGIPRQPSATDRRRRGGSQSSQLVARWVAR